MPRRQPLKLGILVPSSNTALEPLTCSMLSCLSSEVSVHFARFAVTKIALDTLALSQFEIDGPIFQAAQLLKDAEVDIIGWSGTSGGWLGFDQDEKLCRAITERLGVPATTSTLALNKALGLVGTKFGLATPYLDDVQAKIIDVYSKAGFEVVGESHLCVAENTKVAEIEEEALDAQIEDVIEQGKGEVKAIATFCTNLFAAQRVAKWEREHDVLVFDTVSTVVWDMLKMKGVDTSRIKGWGKLFEL